MAKTLTVADVIAEQVRMDRDRSRAPRATRPRLVPVPAASPERPHRHSYTHPVFTERRVDGLPIKTGEVCEGCGEERNCFEIGRPA